MSLKESITRLCELEKAIAADPWSTYQLTPSNISTPDGRIAIAWTSPDHVENKKAEATAKFIVELRNAWPAICDRMAALEEVATLARTFRQYEEVRAALEILDATEGPPEVEAKGKNVTANSNQKTY